MGADELMHHAEERLGIKAGGTTPDGLITLEHAECQAACTEAPCLQVNYRYRYRITHRAARRPVRRPRAGALEARDPAARDAGHGASADPGRPRRRSARARRTSPGPPPWIPRPARKRARHEHRHPDPARPGLHRRRPAGDRDVAVRVRGLLHARRATSPRAATRVCAPALGRTPQAVHEEVRSATCSGAAAPGSRPASSGGSPRRACGRATSSSTATRASPARTRTAC